jgi:hypothetical protein
MYSKQVEFLSYIDELQREISELRVKFLCRCVCESTYPTQSPYPLWQVHHFSTAQEVRSWIDAHKGHESYVSVQTEGIRPSSGPQPTRDEGNGTRKSEVLEKLRALAEGTPFLTEADAALQKIRELERYPGGVDSATANQ